MRLKAIYDKLDVTRFRVRRIGNNEDYLITGMKVSGQTWAGEPKFTRPTGVMWFTALRLDASMQRSEHNGDSDEWALLSCPEEVKFLNSLFEHEMFQIYRKSYS